MRLEPGRKHVAVVPIRSNLLWRRVIVGRTDAGREVRNIQEFVERGGPSGSRSVGNRFPQVLTRRTIVGYRRPEKIRVGTRHSPRFANCKTVGNVLDQLSGINQGRHFVAGTPDVVADEIEKWLDVDGIDGIDLSDVVVSDGPEFYRCRSPPRVTEPRAVQKKVTRMANTLRERLFGAGNARLPAKTVLAHAIGIRMCCWNRAEPLRFAPREAGTVERFPGTEHSLKRTRLFAGTVLAAEEQDPRAKMISL